MLRTYTLDELAEVECVSSSLQYNTAGADVLTLSGLTAQWASRLGWTRWDQVMILDGGVPIFVGTVTEGIELAAQGGAAPLSSFSACSDWGILERTAYTAVREDGTPNIGTPGTDGTEQLPPYDTSVGPDGTIYKHFYTGPRWTSSKSKEPTASTSEVLAACFDLAANWTGSRMTSTLACTLAGQTIPMNQAGASSCAQLMLAAMEWTPDAVIRMGYPEASRVDGSGLVMHIDESASLDPITIDADYPHYITSGESADYLGRCDGITDISLRPRPDLVLPAAALIGAQHFSIGGDAREPGSFVYCVTRNKPAETRSDSGTGEEEDPMADNVPAYTAPDEKKTIISGLKLPPRTTLNGEHFTHRYAVDQVTHDFLAHFFPVLDAIGRGNYLCGAPILIPAAEWKGRPAADAGNLPDKDAGTPANYDAAFLSNPNRLGAVYIHTEGSFPASSRASRNVPGLKWCKGEFKVRLAIAAPPTTVPREVWDGFFSGRIKKGDVEVYRYTDVTISGNFINSRRRIVRGVEPLSNDPGPDSTEDEEPPPPEDEDEEEDKEPEPAYAALLTEYYNASQTLCHEGSLTLLAPTVHPSDILGRCVRVTGLADDWATMTAICRSISYDITTGRMTLALGSREVLGYDMRLERAEMSLRRARNEREVERISDPVPPLADATPPDEGTDENQDNEKEEDGLMVSPSVNASLSVPEKAGKMHRPFEIYKDGGQVYMQGGSYWVGDTELKIKTTAYEVEGGQATATPLEWGRIVRRRVYQRTNSSTGALEWTYDIKMKTQ